MTEKIDYSIIPSTDDITSSFSQKEIERKNIGVALVVVASDSDGSPLIWTITELKEKEQTERKVGHLSIPGETRKPGETDVSNVLGALAEFCSDDLLGDENASLIVSRKYKDALIVNGHYVADLLVIVYSGDQNISIHPVNEEEVQSNGWMSLQDIRRSSHVRPFLRDFVNNEQTSAILIDALKDSSNEDLDVRRLLPQGVSLQEFYLDREQTADIPLEV